MDSSSAKSSEAREAMHEARWSLHFTVAAKKGNTPLVRLTVAGLALALGATTVRAVHAQGVTRAADEKNWQAVAPGRGEKEKEGEGGAPGGVEPVSGEIKIAAPLAGLIAEVPVKAGDKVAAGELLVRLRDRELQARIANAEAQIAMRKRARTDQAPSSRAGDRRKAEDAVSDGEQAVMEAQA